MNTLFKPAAVAHNKVDRWVYFIPTSFYQIFIPPIFSTLSTRKLNGLHDKLVGDGKRQRMKVQVIDRRMNSADYV
jgi:hypothetical protein